MAAVFQLTTRRSATQHPQALSPGASVNATLVAATGPQIRVMGLSTSPMRVPDVLESRLAPKGTLTALEKNGLAACHNAQAGQAMNQTSWAGSPQAQVRVDVGCPVQNAPPQHEGRQCERQDPHQVTRSFRRAVRI